MYHFLDKPKSWQKFDWWNLSLIKSYLVNKNRCSFSFSSDHEIIDVVDAPAKPHPSYDMAKARSLMHECDRHVNFARMEECPDDWEEQISRFKQTSVILQAGPHPLIILISLFWWRITVVFSINQSVHRPFEIICLRTVLFIHTVVECSTKEQHKKPQKDLISINIKITRRNWFLVDFLSLI